jgi:hypothetical protein
MVEFGMSPMSDSERNSRAAELLEKKGKSAIAPALGGCDSRYGRPVGRR